MKHFLTLFFTALLALTASGAANVGVGSLPVLAGFTNGQYIVVSTGNSSNSPLRLVPFSVVSNGWLSVQKFTDGLLVPSSNLTNYTVTATTAERTINATNNIHFSSVSGGSSGQKMFPSFTVTNFSGADRLLTFASGWTAYGSPTNTVPSGKTARVMFEVEGSNVRYGVTIEGESVGGGGSFSLGSTNPVAVYRNNSSLDLTNHTAETNFLSYSIPASSLSTNRHLRYVVSGFVTNVTGATRTIRVRVYLGSTTLWDQTSGSITTNAPVAFRLQGELVNNDSASAQTLGGFFSVSALTAGATAGYGLFNNDEQISLTPIIGLGAEDTSSSKDFRIAVSLSNTGDIYVRKLISYAVLE